MTKFQLFTRKPGQLAVGNKYAIYNTLAEAQSELRRWLISEYAENDNIGYLDDGIISAIDLVEYRGYDGAGFYKALGDGQYTPVLFDYQINSDDFTEFSYDLTKYYIEEIEVENV